MTALDATFNGTALSTAVPSARIQAKGFKRPGMSDNRDKRVQVSGGAGDWLFADNPGDGTIEVPIAIVSTSWSAVRSAVRLVAAWAKSTTRKKLVFSDESSVYWYAKLADDWYAEEEPFCGILTLKFGCLPYAYSTSVTTEGPYSASSGVAHTWSVSDTVDAYPNIEIASSGGVTGGLTLNVNGNILSVPSNIAASGYRTVLSTAYVVTSVADSDTELVGSYSAANVAMTGVTGDFGKLNAGTSNSVTVTTANGSATTVTIRWRRRYD